MKRNCLKIFVVFWMLTMVLATHIKNVSAVSDPRNQPNNKVCVGILSPETDVVEAAAMVNAKSDWGYVVVVIKVDERNVDRWQGILNQMSKKHIIPIFRIATIFDSSGNWQKPGVNDADEWADFFSKLYFPTKNKYIQVYNEVNRAGEWGGHVDPAEYAAELSKTIDALKDKGDDFFLLNAPLDLALATSSDSMDAGRYFDLMEEARHGIFAKLDGWASHSYPNPNFSASPEKSGRLGIDGYNWELAQVEKYLGGKNLSVFITETGWKRSELLDENQIAEYFAKAFSEVWSDSRIASVCPFVFNYPDPLFNQFSFKTDGKVLGRTYYNYYYKIQDLSKIVGSPTRDNLLSDLNLSFPQFVIRDQMKTVFFTFKNSGNFIWNAREGLSLNVAADGVFVLNKHWGQDEVYPGQEAYVEISIVSSKTGDIPVVISLFDRDQKLSEKEVFVKSETRWARLIRIVTALIS